MELNRQIQTLVEESAGYGIAPIVIQKAIAPVLLLVAQQLEHSEYYIMQNLREDWVISVISGRENSEFSHSKPNSKLQNSEKKVIYGFVTVKDAKNFSSNREPDLVAISLPIIQILFRVFSLQQIDSIIFFPQSENTTKGIEVKRRQLQNSIQEKLQQLKTIPRDLA